MSKNLTRRTFGLAATAGLATALSASRVAGANEKLRLAFIGVGNRGSQLIEATLPIEGMEIVAICDVFSPYLDKWQERLGGSVAVYEDYRRLLERDDIDAGLRQPDCEPRRRPKVIQLLNRQATFGQGALQIRARDVRVPQQV